MEEETHLFADADIEILPPETSAVGSPLSICDCCGKTALIDDDCYGICQECFSA